MYLIIANNEEKEPRIELNQIFGLLLMMLLSYTEFIYEIFKKFDEQPLEKKNDSTASSPSTEAQQQRNLCLIN